jgi:hypothetical protein
MKKIARLAFAVLVVGRRSFAGNKTFTGIISDTLCGIKHSAASDAAAECVEKCVAGGARYVLVADDGRVYLFDTQDQFKGLGGKRVTVKGTLSGSTITVASLVQK